MDGGACRFRPSYCPSLAPQTLNPHTLHPFAFWAARTVLAGRTLLRKLWKHVLVLLYRLPLNQQIVLSGAAVGVIAGIAAFLLEGALHGISVFGLHRLADLPLMWRIPATIALPGLGGLVAGLLIHRFCPEAKGHGIQEVMHALEHNKGRISAKVGWTKLLATAATLGTGGSAGREGPIIQIGAAAGSWLGSVFRVPVGALKTLVAAGIVGGLSAAFSIPMAGVFFTMEVILRNFANRAFPAVVVASVSGAVTARVLMGTEDFFIPLTYEWRNPLEIFFFALVGLACIPVGALYRETLGTLERGFARLRLLPDWMRPALGGLLVGVIALGVPQVTGTGLDTMNRVLGGENLGWFLIVLVLGKILATGLTLGSGGAGGTMMPSLFVGAMLGAGLGQIMNWQELVPLETGGLAAVGMACMFTAVFRAPVTAMIMAFETTRDYGILVPAMLACTLTHLFGGKQGEGTRD